MGSLRRWAMNRADFTLGVFLGLALTVLILLTAFSQSFRLALFGSTDAQKSMASALIAAVAALTLAVVVGIVKVTSARQSLTSLITSEIIAIQYGILTMDMFDFWGRVFAHPAGGTLGFADTPRQEDYFQLFHSAALNVGNLHPRAVEAIVRFYSYLKMSRDAAAALHSWKEQEDFAVRQMHVRYVIEILALSMNWGFVALWCMGSVCQKQDWQLLEKARAAYNRAFDGAFEAFFNDHPRIWILTDFFEQRQKTQGVATTH